jgi:hypothetical protein
MKSLIKFEMVTCFSFRFLEATELITQRLSNVIEDLVI